MSFEKQITDIDLGDTPIENIFINDYMPMANGTFVKVYLLGYKYAHDRDGNIEVDNMTITKHLNIPLSDVLAAWDFWQDKGIIEKIEDDGGDPYKYKVRFLNLKQLYIKNNFQHISTSIDKKKEERYNVSVEDLLEANEIPTINKMFNNLDYIMRRQLVPNEKQRILEWIHKYNINTDVVEKAFFHAIEKRGTRNINYVGGILRNWYDLGLTNIEALMEHFKKTDEKRYLHNRVMQYLGYGNRLATESETKTMTRWFDEYEYSLDLVLKACENTKKIPNPNINYVDSIIKTWYDKGIRTIKDIENLDTKPKEKKRVYRSKSKTPNRFHNFDQRSSNYTADELEEIARKKREEYYIKAKGDQG